MTMQRFVVAQLCAPLLTEEMKRPFAMYRAAIRCCALFLLSCPLVPAFAQPMKTQIQLPDAVTEAAELGDDGSDIWARPTLTGNWGG